jgi:hypothetical protein
LPNLSSAYWVSQANIPTFIKNNEFRRYLRENETVFILPVWPRDEALMWQAQTDMYFSLAQGAGPWPSRVERWPILDAFLREQYIPDAAMQFRAYLSKMGVQLLIVDDRSSPFWKKLAGTLAIAPVSVGGVTLYRLSQLAGARVEPGLDQSRRSYDETRMATLIIGIQRYLGQGGEVEALNASRLADLKLIPTEDIIGPGPPIELPDPEENWNRYDYYRYGMVLMLDKGRVVVGERAWGPSADQIITDFRDTASEEHYVVAPDYHGPRADQLGMLILAFEPAKLTRAAEAAETMLQRTGKPLLAAIPSAR